MSETIKIIISNLSTGKVVNVWNPYRREWFFPKVGESIRFNFTGEIYEIKRVTYTHDDTTGWLMGVKYEIWD